jgi:hypothetical protein
MRLRFVSRLQAPNVVVSRVTGHATVGLAQRYTSLLEGEILRAPVEIFHDWSNVVGYDTDARRHLNDFNAVHGASVVQAHMLVSSKIIAMGISVSSLLAQRDFAAYTDRREWERALAALYPGYRRLLEPA